MVTDVYQCKKRVRKNKEGGMAVKYEVDRGGGDRRGKMATDISRQSLGCAYRSKLTCSVGKRK